MHANMSSRPFQLLTTLDWNEWVWTEFQASCPDKSKQFCSHLVGDLVLLVKILGHGVLIICINLWLGFYNYGLWVVGNFSPHTILGLVWDTGQTESSFQLGECQAAWVNSFPLVWKMTPCPLPHKSSGPQVLYFWSPRWLSIGVMALWKRRKGGPPILSHVHVWFFKQEPAALPMGCSFVMLPPAVDNMSPNMARYLFFQSKLQSVLHQFNSRSKAFINVHQSC